jgi:multidrug transporter EmrE-like cation transporter
MYFLRALPYFLLTLFFSLTGQSLLKKGVNGVLAGNQPGPREFVRSYLLSLLSSPLVIAGFLTSGVGFFCFMFVLSRFELGRALPLLGAVSYILLFLIGKTVLKEEVRWVNLAGIGLIVLGAYLVSLKTIA